MTDRNPASEEERAIATLARCELQLRRAQETVRNTGEMLRRAVRTAENAEGEFGDATRRVDRSRRLAATADHPPGD
jgi:hypothetical protein